MVRGLYTAYTGMMQQQARLEVVSNNLANATTVGFKKEGSTSQAFDSMLAIKVKDASEHFLDRTIGNVSLGVKVGETYTDYGQGSFKSTGNLLDVAIAGDGFFAISYTSKNGVESTMYQRAGNFTLTNDGFLVTKDGDYVLGQDGPINIPTQATIAINELGEIYADNEYVDRFNIVDFEDYNYLSKFGENMYEALNGATFKEPQSTKVQQGYLEMSNVNVVSEMVEMISISRAYESNQKLITSIDETLGKAVTIGQL